jgi:hypothetical protein
MHTDSFLPDDMPIPQNVAHESRIPSVPSRFIEGTLDYLGLAIKGTIDTNGYGHLLLLLDMRPQSSFELCNLIGNSLLGYCHVRIAKKFQSPRP